MATVALIMVPAAFNSSTRNGLSGSVTVDTRSVVTCPDDDCGSTTTRPPNTVWMLLHVTNTNAFTWAPEKQASRETLVNAFVVNSVDQDVYVNGTKLGGTFTYYSPPGGSGYRTGRWINSVTWDGSSFSVGHPAVVPGESAVAFYAGWLHAVNEPDGKHVFEFTVRGTVNGSPAEVTMTSPPITMTR